MKKEKEKRRPFLVRFEPEAWVRLNWLHRRTANGFNGESLDRQRKSSLADIVNSAVMEYRRDDLTELEERKKRVARELNAELAAIDLQIKATIERKEREKERN